MILTEQLSYTKEHNDNVFHTEFSSPQKKKVLKKRKSFVEQIVYPNTKYVIKHSFDLEGRTIMLPENCELVFKGGEVHNGKLKLNDTKISNNKQGSINVYFEGQYNHIFDLYDTSSPQINKSIIETCRAGIRLKSDIIVCSCKLYTSLFGDKHSVRFMNDDIVGFYVLSDSVTVSNVTIYKPLLDATSYNKRRAVYLLNVNDFTIEDCNIYGQLFFRSEDNLNGRNIRIYNCCINADYSVLEQNHELENDVITAYGIKNLLVDNCVINAKDVTRVFKTSASKYLIDSNGCYQSYSNPSSNITISNNTITSKCRNGKQLFDMFIGTKDVIVNNNIITAIGHTRLFENKTSQDGAVSQNPNYYTNIIISNNICETDASFAYFNLLDSSSITISNNSIRLIESFDRELLLINSVDRLVISENSFVKNVGVTHSPSILVSESFKNQESIIGTLMLRDNYFDVSSELFMSVRNANINEIHILRNKVSDIYRGIQFRDNAKVNFLNVEHSLVRKNNYLIHALQGSYISRVNIDAASDAGNRVLLDEGFSVKDIDSKYKLDVYYDNSNESLIRRYIKN